MRGISLPKEISGGSKNHVGLLLSKKVSKGIKK